MDGNLPKFDGPLTPAPDQAAAENKRQFHDLTPEEMHTLFNKLAPRRGMEEKMKFGIKFLNLLLDERGPKETEEFIHDVSSILAKDGVLYEYDPPIRKHRKTLQHARGTQSRREFIETVALGWGGYALFTGGLAGVTVAADVNDHIRREQDPAFAAREDEKDQEKTPMRRAADFGAEYVAPVGEGLLTRKLVVEAKDDWKKLRFSHIDQIANAVAEVRNRYPELGPPALQNGHWQSGGNSSPSL